ncbi:MAG: TraR/DksA C4-type zinc finger protein [Kiritimatiellae bacterium]|nr:TraR/DksA C4-type zinc finger protein [Kiritimatiellia bacterium]
MALTKKKKTVTAAAKQAVQSAVAKRPAKKLATSTTKKSGAVTAKSEKAKPTTTAKAAPAKTRPATRKASVAKAAAVKKPAVKTAAKSVKRPASKKTAKTVKPAAKGKTVAPKKIVVPKPVIIERVKQPLVQPRPPFQPVPTLAQTQAKKMAESKKQKPRFSKEDLQQFKNELLAMRNQLMGRAGSMRNAALQGTDDINPEEDGTDAFLRQQTLDQVKKQHELIANIDTALRAIEDGTYGICCNCGELIRKQRLSYLPFAKHCITCQSELDRQTMIRK